MELVRLFNGVDHTPYMSAASPEGAVFTLAR